jgi:hypothetical protein
MILMICFIKIFDLIKFYACYHQIYNYQFNIFVSLTILTFHCFQSIIFKQKKVFFLIWKEVGGGGRRVSQQTGVLKFRLGMGEIDRWREEIERHRNKET